MEYDLRDIQVRVTVKYNNINYSYIGVVNDLEDRPDSVRIDIFGERMPLGFTEEFGYHGLDLVFRRTALMGTDHPEYSWVLGEIIDLDIWAS